MYNEEAYQETTTQSPGKERKRSFAFLGGFLTALVLVGVVFAIYHFMFNKEAEIRRIIRDQYIGDVSEEAIEEGKYYGMVDALDDKYSKYFNKEEYQELYQNTHGVFVGLGIVFLSSDDGKELVIADIYEGAPADGCGLAVGDRVVTINGEAPGDGFTVDALSAGMQSGEIKEVTIVVTREGTEEPIEAVITPGPVDVPTVRHTLLEDGIGYISISNFRDATPEKFRKAYEELTEQNMSALIIDLRGNGGGLVTSAVDTLNVFVPEGLLVSVVSKSGNTKEYTSACEEPITVPVAVLVDETTVSSAEIFAGAVHDRGVGILIGEQTFGKGIVQNIKELRDHSAVRITTSTYYTPDGTDLNGTGLAPDIEVALPDGGVPDLTENDLPFQRALEELKKAT